MIGPLLFFIALFTLLLLTGGVMFELVRQMVDKSQPALRFRSCCSVFLAGWPSRFHWNLDGIAFCVHPSVGEQ